VLSWCTTFNGCIGSPLEQLAHRPISGTVVFPAQGVDVVPDDPEWGIYEFPTQAYMTLRTGVSAFDLAEQTPVTVHVHNCIGERCPGKEDLVWVSVRHAGWDFYLTLNPPGLTFDTDDIPSVQQLAQPPGLWAGFDIVNSADWSVAISTDGGLESPLQVTVTSVPFATAGAENHHLIPMLPMPLLAALGLAMIGIAFGTQDRKRAA
jgi:hypothetical protein